MAVKTSVSLLLLALLADSAAAGVIVDVADRDVDGLIAAVHAANLRTESTTIRLAEGGLYTLTTPADENRELGFPIITGQITIRGNGADIRRYSNDEFALFAIAKGGELTLDRLTLAEGSRGALVNHGQLELNRVHVIDNTAKGVPAIIENYGRLRATDSEISFNQLAATQRDAGTVLNYGRLELVRSSIESNWISRRFDTLIAASAVLNLGEMKLVSVNVRENTASAAQDDAALAAIINAGNGAFESTGLKLENNEPTDTSTVARSLN